MSRLQDIEHEIRVEKHYDSIIRAVEFELEGTLNASGVELHGLSINILPGSCLCTLRVTRNGRREVTFVGAEDIGTIFTKAVKLARTGKLNYRRDKYHNEQI